MRFLRENEIQEYVNFLKQYYSVTNLKLCIVETSESEWKLLYTKIKKGVRALDTAVNERIVDQRSIDLRAVGTSHSMPNEDESYQNSMGYFISSGNLRIIIKSLWKDSDAVRAFMHKLEGTEYFIMLRVQCSYLRTRPGYLDTLFHEILRTIEAKSQQRIFRGDSIEQDFRDNKEIVMPYVKLFLKEKQA